MTEKETLRRALLARRAALPDREDRDARIFAGVAALEEYRRAHTLLCYVSVGEEADTRRLLHHALAEWKAVFAPVCRPGGRLAFHRVQAWQELTPAAFGLLEPDPARCAPWQPAGETLCIVPGLAFDPQGNRLGYGKGYYDRFLAENELTTVGLCYGDLLLPGVPTEDHDRPVDLLVTEDGIFRPRRGPSKEESPHE